MSDCGCGAEQAHELERRTLVILLIINAVMFATELALGILAESAGLIGDSLDMLADAGVYGLSLYAVGRSLQKQSSAARVSGVLQVMIGVCVLLEVLRRFLLGSDPQSLLMMTVASVALLANARQERPGKLPPAHEEPARIVVRAVTSVGRSPAHRGSGGRGAGPGAGACSDRLKALKRGQSGMATVTMSDSGLS